MPTWTCIQFSSVRSGPRRRHLAAGWPPGDARDLWRRGRVRIRGEGRQRRRHRQPWPCPRSAWTHPRRLRSAPGAVVARARRTSCPALAVPGLPEEGRSPASSMPWMHFRQGSDVVGLCAGSASGATHLASRSSPGSPRSRVSGSPNRDGRARNPAPHDVTRAPLRASNPHNRVRNGRRTDRVPGVALSVQYLALWVAGPGTQLWIARRRCVWPWRTSGSDPDGWRGISSSGFSPQASHHTPVDDQQLALPDAAALLRRWLSRDAFLAENVPGYRVMDRSRALVGAGNTLEWVGLYDLPKIFTEAVPLGIDAAAARYSRRPDLTTLRARGASHFAW